MYPSLFFKFNHVVFFNHLFDISVSNQLVMEALEKLPSSRYVDRSSFVKDRVLISPISQRHLTGEFEKKYIGTRS